MNQDKKIKNNNNVNVGGKLDGYSPDDDVMVLKRRNKPDLYQWTCFEGDHDACPNTMICKKSTNSDDDKY